MNAHKVARRSLGALMLAVVAVVLLGIPVLMVGWLDVLKFFMVIAAIFVCFMIGNGVRWLAERGWKLLFEEE
jgi:hypothetical protein